MSSRRGTPAPARPAPSLWLVGLLLVTVSLIPVAVADEHAPRDPVNIYGTAVDETGTPAPAGTTVHAVVDGEIRSSVTVDEAGAVGAPGAFAERLVVDTGAGEEVRFTVGGPDGPTAFETLSLANATNITEIALTFPAGTFEGRVVPDTLSLSIANSTVTTEETTAATVTATFASGVQTDVTDAATVESLDPGVVTVENGALRGESEGVATVRAGYTVGNTTRTDTATVTVEVGEPVFEVVAVDAPATAAPGERLPVDATVRNVGAAGTAAVTHEFRGEQVNETTVELSPGEQVTVAFVVAGSEEATTITHTVRTPDDSRTVTTAVEDERGTDGGGDPADGTDDGTGDTGDDSTTDGGSDDASGPGFGLLAVVVAALALGARLR